MVYILLPALYHVSNILKGTLEYLAIHSYFLIVISLKWSVAKCRGSWVLGRGRGS